MLLVSAVSVLFHLVPGIHVFTAVGRKAWMAGTSSAKTRFALLPGHDGLGDVVAVALAPVIMLYGPRNFTIRMSS